MKMKLILTVFPAALLLTMIVSCEKKQETAESKVTTLHLQSWASENDKTFDAAKEFAEIVRRASDGRLDIKVHKAGAKIPQGKEFEGVISGQVDMVHGPPGWTTDYLPGATFFTHWVGGLTPNQIEMWMKLEGREIAQRLYGKTGVHFAGILTLSPPEVWGHTREPLNSVADIKGLSMRIGGGDVQAIFAKMGASPVLLPGGKIYDSAKAGTIDAFEYINPSVNINMTFNDVFNYMYMDPSRAPCDTQVLWINKSAWNKLPTSLQEIVSMATDKVAREYYIQQVDADTEALKLFKEKGIVIAPLPADIRELLNEKAIEYYNEESLKDADFKILYEKSLSWKKKCEKLDIK